MFYLYFLFNFEMVCKFVQQIVLKQTRYCMSIPQIPTQKQTKKTLDFRTKFKTQKCRFLYEKGFCPFNKFCAFAHTQQEIREKRQLNLKYKTRPCHNFIEYGFCKYGDRCQYLHSSFQNTSDGDKTRSNSEQSYSSKSSNQQKAKTKNLNRQEFKHRARFQMLRDKDLELFQMMVGNKSRIDLICSVQTENASKTAGIYEEATNKRNKECTRCEKHDNYLSNPMLNQKLY